MNELYMQVTITSRGLTRKFISFYEKQGLEVSFISFGHGTASSEILRYFGLEEAEKSILFHIVTGRKWKEQKHLLQMEMQIDIPGIGIVFLIPLSSIGGRKALSYLTCGQEFVQKEESTLKDTKLELLVVISNQGYTELIMDAARKVHTIGGTVIHARGTGNQMAEKFMGVTLVPEKDMLFIVVQTEQKNAVMESIMKETGTGTKVGAVVFSLPVTDTAGLHIMEEVQESGEEI